MMNGSMFFCCPWANQLLLAVIVSCGLFANSTLAQTTALTRAKLVEVNQQIQKAQKLFAEAKYEESAKVIGNAQTALNGVPRTNDFKSKSAKKKLQTMILTATTMLEAKGAKVPVAEPVVEPEPAPAPGGEDMAAMAGGVSFINEIGPLFAEKCIHCHGGDETRGQLRLVTFEGIQKGGNNGPLFRGVNTKNSLLLQRLRGEGDGEQMPPDDDPLTPEQISLIEKWIASGAPFDGGDAAAAIPELIMQFQVGKMSHEELWKQRAALIQKNWDLGMPGVNATTFETKSLRVMGTSAAAEMKKVAEAAEGRLDEVAEILGAASDRPLLKGGATIYLVSRRYDYSEFGQMVEQRTLPRGSQGHWRYNGRDAYGVALFNNEDQFSKEALIAEQVAGMALASRGTPGWFSEGVGLAVAGRLEPKDARIEALRDQAKDVLRQGFAAQKFLSGDLPPDQSRLIGFAFAERLMASKKSWSELMAAVQAGESFSKSFATAYRATPDRLLAGLRVK